MSNARGNSRRTGGNASGPATAGAAAAPVAPMGAAFSRREKDDLRSKIVRIKNRYADLCDDPGLTGNRFRVRAEILPGGEDYMTVEMGCHIQGVIALDWSEYGSADLEIRFGSQLELARKLKTMVRRSSDRLGYPLDIPSAQAILGTPAESRLLMSNSEFSRLPAAERLAARPQVGRQVVHAQPAPSFYARQADAAASAMAQEVLLRQSQPGPSVQAYAPLNDGGVSLPWADEMNQQGSSTNGRSGAPAQTPHSNNESGLLATPGSRVATPHDAPKGRAPPVPSGPPLRQVPAPSTVSTGGRVAPPPSAAG